MASSVTLPRSDHRRPWTVVALMLLRIAFTLWGLISGFDVRNLIAIAFSGLVIWGLWNARRWAYFLTLVGAAFAAVVFVSYILGDFERVGVVEKALWGVQAAATALLLGHPMTRAFFPKNEASATLPEDSLRRP